MQLEIGGIIKLAKSGMLANVALQEPNNPSIHRQLAVKFKRDLLGELLSKPRNSQAKYASPLRTEISINHSMSLRTDNISGAITCAFGIVMVAFASFGLMIVALQRLILTSMPPIPQNPGAPPFTDMINGIHGVWFVYLPLMIGGGIIYAIAGFHVRRGSLIARRVAQANALAGYIWGIGYLASCYRIMQIMPPPLDLPEPASMAFRLVTMIFGTLVSAAFPTGLLFILSRRAGQAAKQSPDSAT